MNKYLTSCIEYSINMVQRMRIEREFVSFLLFLDSSMVEHTAVNRGVVGSSPTRGAFSFRAKIEYGDIAKW